MMGLNSTIPSYAIFMYMYLYIALYGVAYVKYCEVNGDNACMICQVWYISYKVWYVVCHVFYIHANYNMLYANLNVYCIIICQWQGEMCVYCVNLNTCCMIIDVLYVKIRTPRLLRWCYTHIPLFYIVFSHLCCVNTTNLCFWQDLSYSEELASLAGGCGTTTKIA